MQQQQCDTYWECLLRTHTGRVRVTGSSKDEAWDKMSDLLTYWHGGLAKGFLANCRLKERRSESPAEQQDTTDLVWDKEEERWITPLPKWEE